MIRPLRTRHRGMVLGVGIVAGALTLAGLAVRHPVPRVAPLTIPADASSGSTEPIRDGEPLRSHPDEGPTRTAGGIR